MSNSDGGKSHIIPPELAVKAMRDSGYKNTAFALSELIDNSVQAGATEVVLICKQIDQSEEGRRGKKLHEIAVLDNGCGMDFETILRALQFGNGTHLSDRSGIGRFGMGLPNSSISQCRRVDVWTWQNGPDNTLHSYLDVDKISSGVLNTVPEPKKKRLPQLWKDQVGALGASGTLVKWSKFDEHRLSWRGARATLANTEELVGRLYRKFIDHGKVAIRLLALDGPDAEPQIDRMVKVNDPLYLMSNSTTPKPFDVEPMFQKWGEEDETFTIKLDGASYDIVVRMSWARPETTELDNMKDRGAQPYGKHAGKNVGLSIVREGRELDLDKGWANTYDPTERWWGVEVEFPSALDEIFGVTNNKQNATIFSQMTQFNWKDEANEGETERDFCARIKQEGDPRALLIPVVNHIVSQLGSVREYLKKQTAGRRSRRKRHDDIGTADRATKKFQERAKTGHSVDSDNQAFQEKDRQAFEANLVKDKKYPKNVAKEISQAILTRNRKVEFLTGEMDGYAFFSVESHQGGITAIVLNTRHPAYEQLVECLQPKTDDLSSTDLLERVTKAGDTLEMLLAAWARYEIEETDHGARLSDTRQEWGKMARLFLEDREDD